VAVDGAVDMSATVVGVPTSEQVTVDVSGTGFLNRGVRVPVSFGPWTVMTSNDAGSAHVHGAVKDNGHGIRRGR